MPAPAYQPGPPATPYCQDAEAGASTADVGRELRNRIMGNPFFSVRARRSRFVSIPA